MRGPEKAAPDTLCSKTSPLAEPFHQVEVIAMKTRSYLTAAAGLALGIGVIVLVQAAHAQPAAPTPPTVAPPVTTLWNFLGIPQGCHKIRDAITNPLGKHPKLERKPPLLRIADPANQLSDDPAIKAAAKIKADQDLAPQKVKAIKFLGTVCCGCAKNGAEVKKALMMALEDCTEEVRNEAAMALCQCAGNPCTLCNKGSCCDAELMTKLQKIATGQDEKGCYYETSSRVRAAAQNALSACQQVHGPTAAPVAPKPKEKPVGPTPVVPKEKPVAPSPSPVDREIPPATLPAPTAGDDSSASARTPAAVRSTGYLTIVVDPSAPRPAVQGAPWLKAAPLLDARWQRPISAAAPVTASTARR